MKPGELERAYKVIEQKVGSEGLVLARHIINAFANGLGREPAGNVDKSAADERALQGLLKISEKFNLVYNNGWPGFEYKVRKDEEHVLGSYSNDPLMPLIIDVAMLFHMDVAEERGKGWDYNVLERIRHGNHVLHALRDMMTEAYRRKQE